MSFSISARSTTVDTIRVWNYNELNSTARSVNDVTVLYSNDGVNFTGTVSGITNFTQANGTTNDPGDTFNAFTAFNARYIKFDIDSNYGDANSFYGLGEVQFEGELVPEPGSLALVGMGGLLIARRRRA
jgi:large repetitive protein